MDHRDVYLNYVAGQWKQGGSGQWDDNRNPAMPGELLGKATRSSAADVERAIDTAQRAQGFWAGTPRPARSAWIAKAAYLLRAKTESLAKIMVRETGATLPQARAELQAASLAIETVAAAGRESSGRLNRTAVPGRIILGESAAWGTVAILTSAKEPALTPALLIAQALSEGNPVVFKPSATAPSTALAIVRAFEEAQLPAGVLNLLYGRGNELGAALAADPRVRAVYLAGRAGTAESLAASCAGRKPFFWESEVQRPIVVAADGDIEAAAEATVACALAHSAISRNKTSRVIVEGAAAERFTEALLRRARELRPVDGVSANTAAISALSSKEQHQAFLERNQAWEGDGVEYLVGSATAASPAPGQGYFAPVTVVRRNGFGGNLARHDHEGPSLALFVVEKLDSTIWDQIGNGPELVRPIIFTGRASWAIAKLQTPGLDGGQINAISDFEGSAGRRIHVTDFARPTPIGVEL